ncbi:MAG: c-type cytochrome, partial [Bryobacteraceae bacterium]
MIWWAALFFLQHQALDMTTATANPYTSPGDVEQGKRLYGGRCAGCHGPAGDGGKGANLAVAVLPRGASDRDLYSVIRYGLAETEMPSSLMPEREIWQVAAFVRTLGKLQSETISGDAKRGEALVTGKGRCLRCHAIGVTGGRMGPALSDVGARRSPGYLRGKLVNPSAEVPELFRLVELKTRKGAAVTGVRLSEDTWSVQVLDFGDRIHSFWKEDLAELKLERRTPMPASAGRLTADEVNDIVAYL